MPRLDDQHHIRRLLRADPAWAVYALADLSPAMFPKTTWFTPDLTLLFRDYGTAILFAMGGGSVREALAEVTGPVHLQVREDALAALSRHATLRHTRLMWRMARREPAPAVDAGAGAPVRLDEADVPALQALYDDGRATGEAPDFFFPSMVRDGVFFGIREGGALTAAAGTHVMSRDEGVAAIGNVYTRRDRRGSGLGRLVTAAVAGALADVETVGLNVRADNVPAIRLYESLGFVRHCPFYEGIAS